MKKVITKKLQADNDSVPSPEQAAPPTPSYDQHTIMAETPSPSIYPPLPVDPPLPPPSADAHPPLVPKREIIDDQNDSSTNEDYEQLQLDNDILQHIKVEPNKIEEMCRDWVRGTCSRENCKYSHVRDLKQLPRVYKFCHDYQNKGCVLPKCKFVHATVHEQEVFIRTGVLPPHALAHLKHQMSTPAPPPPLPPSDAPLPGPSGQHLVRNVVMHNPNPMPSTSRARMDLERPSTSRMNSAPMLIAGPSGVANPLSRMPPPVPPPNWTGEPSCSTPEEGCRNCVVMEHRVQHAKNNLANINKNLERSAKELLLLDQKEKRLMAVMNLWFQTCNNGGNSLGSKNNSNNPNNNNNQNQ